MQKSLAKLLLLSICTLHPACSDRPQKQSPPPLEAIAQKPSLEKARRNGVALSNGMTISGLAMLDAQTIDKETVYRVDTGYPSPKYDMIVHDPNDGKPYVFTKNVQGREVKRFNLTYEFEGTPYPIWEPTAFRTNPQYGVIPSEKALNRQ